MKTYSSSKSDLASLAVCLLIFGALQIASAQTNYQKIASYGTGGLTGTNEPGTAGEIYGALIEGDDGRLYGVTASGGTAGGSFGGAGTVFALNKDGTGAAILHNFIADYGPTDGAYPIGSLLQASDGFLYGTTPNGGGAANNFVGTIFKVNTAGSGYSVIYFFNSPGGNLNGFFPERKLMEGTDGSLYGGTSAGGANGDGVIFKHNKDGTGYTVLHHLNDATVDGVADLFLSTDGMLYGASYAGGPDDSGSLFKVSTNGTGFSVLHHFPSSAQFGSYPQIVEGSDGNIYGTVTIWGDETAEAEYIFRIEKSGANYTNLHTFGSPGDGIYPQGIIEAGSGALYGTTYEGGSGNAGTIFKIGKDGSGYEILHHFQTGGNGSYPTAPPVQASDGYFYGNTTVGGDLNAGTIYRLSGATVGGAPTIQFSALPGNVLQLSWPSNFLGWRLQAQTNAPGVGLTSSWSTITNSTATNLWTLPLNPTVGSVFLRLAPP